MNIMTMNIMNMIYISNIIAWMAMTGAAEALFYLYNFIATPEKMTNNESIRLLTL